VANETANRLQGQLKRFRVAAGDAYGKAAAVLVPDEVNALNRFRFVVEFGLGIGTENWTLALEKHTFDFTTLHSATVDMEPFVLSEVSAIDPLVVDLRNFHLLDGKYCDYLRRKSIQAIDASGWKAKAIASESPGKSRKNATRNTEILQKCVGCHQSGVGPFLPFGRKEELSELLRTKPYPRGFLIDEIMYRLSPEAGAGRMPLSMNITDEERNDLVTYFRELANFSRR